MATTSSQPGPSSGMRSPGNEFNSTECFSELVDLLALTFDDDPRETPGAGTRIRDFLRDNKLTVVPTTGTLDEHEVQKRNLRKEVETLSQQLIRMDELSQELSDKDKLAKELERKMKGVEARFGRMTEEIQGLRRRCAHIEEQNRILLKETANKEEKYNLEKRKLDDERKKVVRDREGINRKMDALNQQVLQAQKEAAEEKGKSETIFKDKDALVGQVKQLEERLRQEKAESARRIQQEQERAQRFQENMLKRNQDVINLKNEKEEWTRERMRFRVFLKELGNRCGCPGQEGDTDADLLLESEQGLNDLMTKIEQILTARNQEKLDMERKMAAVQQLQGFLSQAQELAQYLQTGSSSTNNIPDVPASVSDSVETCSTTDAMIPAFGTTTSAAENETPANNPQTSVRPDSPFRSMDTSLNNSQCDEQDLESRPESPPIAIIVGVSTVTVPNAGNSNAPKSTLPPTPPPEEARSPRKRPSSPDPPTPSKRSAFQNSGIFTVHKIQMMVDSPANVQSQNTPATPVQPQVPQPPPVPLIVITPPHSTVGNSSTSCNRPRAEIVSTPRPEAPRGPSIVVPLIERPTPAQALPVINPLPSPPSSTATTPQQVQPEPEQSSNRRMSNGSRLYKQFTPFSPNTKQHGINRARAHHTCLCGNIYQNEKGLKVHIRKMTKEWKYKCGACLQYFFYQSDLSRHLKVSAKCSKNVSNGDSQGSFTHFLEDLLATPPDAVQPPLAGTTNSTPSTSTRKGSSRKNASPRSSKRKLQQSIFRNKKHVPWSKQTVSGSWMCSCGSKFSSKCNLEMHSQYFTREWQFRCEQCPGKYFFLSYLKKHMKDSHGIQDAFKEYRLGCHLCGEMFVGRKDYYVHRKLAHDEHSPPARRARGLMSQFRGISSQVPEPPQSSTSNNPVATSSATTQDIYNISTVDDDQEDVTVVRVVRPSPSPTKQPSATPATSNVAPPPPPSPQNSPPQAPLSQVPSSSSSPNNSSSQKKHAPVQQDPLSIDSDEAEIFKCQCGKTYLSKTALNHHIKKMTVGSIYVCLKCSRSFQELCNLKTHMRTIHEESYKGFSCGKCKKRFVNALVFEKHRREEHDELSETSYDTDIDMLD